MVVRFCPKLFELNPHNADHPPVIPLPYRMIFAVATRKSVYLYDTQQRTPFAIVSNIHYTRLTDLTWSPNGFCLIVSSTDGFCSIISFDEDELGNVYCEKKVVSALIENKVRTEKVQEPSKGLSQVNTSNTALIIEAGDKFLEIPADKIISVAEQFSPTLVNDKPITPIAIRRRPRDEVKTEPEKSSTKVSTPPKTDYKAVLTPKKKGATPIAIRKTPRTQIIPEMPQSNMATDDIAVDAWPIDQKPPTSSTKTVNAMLMSPVESDNTQHICLMVDENGCPQENETQPIEVDAAKDQSVPTTSNPTDCMVTQPKSTNKTPKTPRRVEFRTISTPKSKKKLLE